MNECHCPFCTVLSPRGFDEEAFRNGIKHFLKQADEAMAKWAAGVKAAVSHNDRRGGIVTHPCWICGRPNERSEGCETATEAEACGACEREFLEAREAAAWAEKLLARLADRQSTDASRKEDDA